MYYFNCYLSVLFCYDYIFLNDFGYKLKFVESITFVLIINYFLDLWTAEAVLY